MLNWTNYERFDWANAQQQPLSDAERADIELFTADVLKIEDAVQDVLWGCCSPPGRFAATVVHIATNVNHCYKAKSKAMGIGEIGLKIYKTTADAKREGSKAAIFHDEQLSRLPGLPNQNVQRTIAAGVSNRVASSRHFIVQEWIAGETLEQLVRRRWPTDPIDSEVARSVITQLLGRIVIPLWSVGVVWWDFRDANFVWNGVSRKLTMIDVDSLAAYAHEILESPDVWPRRDKGRKTAISRLHQMVLRVLLSQGIGPRATVTRTVKQAWNDELQDMLMRIGKQSVDANADLDRFLRRLGDLNLLPS